MYKRQDWLHLHGQQAAGASSSDSESDKTGALTDTTCSMRGIFIYPVIVVERSSYSSRAPAG